MYITKVSLAKTSATATDYVLALATLGGSTQVGSFLFILHHLLWPRQVESNVTVASTIELNFVN